MHRQLYVFACSIVFCLFLGCRPPGVTAPVTGASADKFQTEMARLAFLAYIGDALTGPYDQVEAELAGCMTSYDSVFGEATHRMWNTFDVVPLAWSHESMGKMAGLYEPFTEASLFERGSIDVVRSATEDEGYSQIDPARPPLSGAVYVGKPGESVSWVDEAEWQHHCGYECPLGIHIDPAVFPDCPSKKPKCYCKDVSTTTGR